jgi:hypothetical protein
MLDPATSTVRELRAEGLRSRAYVPGPLAPDDFEGTIGNLWQSMMRRLAAPPDAASLMGA